VNHSAKKKTARRSVYLLASCSLQSTSKREMLQSTRIFLFCVLVCSYDYATVNVYTSALHLCWITLQLVRVLVCQGKVVWANRS